MNKKNQLISVIVPCYNVQQYVEKAIKSIANQTYDNIEIIAVDDASTDGTYSKLLNLKQNLNEKLTVIKNEKNSGSAAHCRNVAMNIAKGEYIGFVDPDDYIDENFYSNLYNKLKEEDSDICVSDIVLVDEKGAFIGGIIPCCNDKDNVNLENILNCGLVASPCNKLFKAEKIKCHPFLEGKMNEDVASILPALVFANDKISYIGDTSLYYYVQRKGSAQNSEFSSKRFDMFEAIDVCLDKIKDVENFDKYAEIILYHQVLMLYTCIIIEIKDKKAREKIIEEFIKRSQKYKLYKNFLSKHYIKCQRKVLRFYYFLVIKLLRFESAKIINFVIISKEGIWKMCSNIKNLFKRLIGKNVIKNNINIDSVTEQAIKQSKMDDADIKISVVIPNYNYAKFMYQRLYSILSQNIKLYEIIILDDMSTDDSRKVIDDIVDKISKYVNIRKVYNTENSGSPFKQWRRGFNLATGDYVWIAEADDFCSSQMVETLYKKIKENRKIQIAYVDTAFIDTYGNIILKTIKNEIDLRKTGHWNTSFVDNGKEEIEKYAFLNCIIANVSSCLIKNDSYSDIFEKVSEYKQAGDFLFYNLVMIKGDICYEAKPMNYYRVHGNNVTSVTKKQKHFDEIVKIHDENRKLVKFTVWHEEEINKRYEFLKKVWNLRRGRKLKWRRFFLI